MTLVVASSGAYRIGEFTGLALLAVLFVALVLRALDVRLGGRSTAAPSQMPLLQDQPSATSVAPPGASSGPAPVAAVWTPRVARRGRHTDAVAAAVVGILLIA